jgi:hypothetical protein
MTGGWEMFAFGTVICLGTFVHGIRMVRRPDQAVDRMPGGMGRGPSLRGIGRIFIVAAPLFWLLWTAILFGFFGPVPNIQTIQLH